MYTRSNLGLSALFVVSLASAPALGDYADWSLNAGGTAGSGTFTEPGVPGFDFVLSGDFIPGDTEVDANDPFDGDGWEARFGDGDAQESLRFGSNSFAGTAISTMTITFAGPVAPGRLGLAVTDLEGEDAIVGASLGGVDLPTSVVAGWFVELFDSRLDLDPGTNDLPSGFDADAAAVVAQFDPDGLLSDELLNPVGTESASGWFLPDAPFDTLTVTHQNRFGGQASMHVYLATAIPEPATAGLLGTAGLLALLRRRR